VGSLTSWPLLPPGKVFSVTEQEVEWDKERFRRLGEEMNRSIPAVNLNGDFSNFSQDQITAVSATE